MKTCKRFWMVGVITCFMLIQGSSNSKVIASGNKTTEGLRAVPPSEWPIWRGPLQDRQVTNDIDSLPTKWKAQGGEGSNLLWFNKSLAGRSTPVVMNGKLYTLCRNKPGTTEEGEKIVCVDAATGKLIWEHPFNVYLSDVPDTRVGWSSVTADKKTGRVYALGVCGAFFCLEGDTGKVVWKRSLHEEYGLLSTYGGRTNVPLIYKDTVIISAIVIGWGDSPKWGLLAKPAHRFFSFDKATGELRWLRGTRLIPYDTTYSTPTVTTLVGKPAMVFGSGDGAIWALQPGTGLPIWKYQFSKRGINSSPLVDSKTGVVYASHSEENWTGTAMGGLVALDCNKLVPDAKNGAPSPKVLWKKYEVMAGKSSPVIVNDKLCVVDDRAKLYLFGKTSGKQLAKKALGTVQRSTPLVAKETLYVSTANGRFYTLRVTDNKIKVLSKQRISNTACDGSPIAANGRLYFPTSEGIYCIALPAAEGSGNAAQANVAKNVNALLPKSTGPPMHLELVPYDTLSSPGEQLQYKVRLYDNDGHFLRNAKLDEVTFSVEGAGDINSEGLFTAQTTNKHEVARIVCKIGELTSYARVRVVPTLPWKWSFEELDDVPLTWVGGRVRYVVRQTPDGKGKIIVKRDTIPTRPGKPNTKLGTRSRLWMGPIGLKNYTIQADVQLTEKDGKLPDFGLVNSRYTLSLFGASQELKLYSWSTHDKRHQAALPMSIKAGTWFTMKFRVRQQGDIAIAEGKIWKRGDEEPAKWMVSIEDTAPNKNGSPGFYGSAKDAEIYIDNVEVYQNK